MRTRRLVPVVAALMTLTACGTQGGQNELAPAPSLESLGACPGIPEGSDAAEFLAVPSVWYEVSAAVSTAKADGDELTLVPGAYQLSGGDAALVAKAQAAAPSVLMHESTAADLMAAQAMGARTFVQSATTDAVPEARVAVATLNGDFAFLGRCQESLMTNPVASLLQAKQADITSVIAKDSREIASILSAVAGPAAPPPSILNPETTPGEILATLRRAKMSLTARVPSWRGPYTICSKIVEGWGDCLDASFTDNTPGVDLYYNPESPLVEIWLLDEHANVLDPIRKLATIDLRILATANGLGLGNNLNLALTPNAQMSIAQLAAGTGASNVFSKISLVSLR